MQDQERSIEERVDAYDSMLALQSGFWQREDAKDRQSLRTFVLDVARRTIHRYGVQQHARMRALDADDVSQNILFYLFEKAPKIVGDPRGWLIGVAIQIVRDYIATNASTEFSPDFDAMTSSADKPGPGETVPSDVAHVVSRLDVIRFRERTKSLSPDEQRAMRLRYVQGLSYGDIALAMNEKEFAVRKALARCRKKLRATLGKARPLPENE